MKQQLEAIRKEAQEKLSKVLDIRELEDFKVTYLGKKGELTQILKGMGGLSAEERPVIGQLANDVRVALEEGIANAKDRLTKALREAKLKSEVIDVTMPGKVRGLGKKHPLTTVLDEIKDIFLGMGYEIAEGPEVETDYHSFEALNIPKNHPARDTQDTFYINENIVLRPHTSPVQVRHMKSHQPPMRIICPGRVYRSDAVDATHSPVFHQVEGLVVDKGVTMGDLVGTLQAFAKAIFGEKTKIRLRPHHFPFTEPSAEVDVSCWGCDGSGCRICKGEGWVEILGAGMVHPNVLRECGIDPEVYSGFAFGMG
ncbi:MAG: phenylalanine--tRNA ligase subunit alpha, partial [Clostridia bacterium]|nr:phenylalanine--tRNA ligase subunit alpha [Clostridia bacterium]